MMERLHAAMARWGRSRQVRALRRYFARQPLVPRACPLCGARDQQLLIRGDRDGIGICTSQCDACGFVFSSPYYSPAVIEEFYQERYRRLFKGQTDPRGLAARQTYLRERAEFYLGFLDRLAVWPGAAGSLLDAGCGEGTLLRTTQGAFPGMRLQGVEPTSTFARNLTLETGIPVAASLDVLPGDLTFDLVTLVHVLEHVHDPVALLRQLGGRLAPGGFLYVDVPDLARHSSIQDLHLAHCSHFSGHTLHEALLQAGLEVVAVSPHQPPTLPPSLYAVARVGAGAAPAAVRPDPERDAFATSLRGIAGAVAVRGTT
jgi:hypothetical protein